MQEEYAAALKSVGWGFIDPPARSGIQAAGADAAAAEAGPGLGKSPPAQQNSGGRASDLDSEGRQPARGRKRCVRQAKEAQSSSPPPAQLVDAASRSPSEIANSVGDKSGNFTEFLSRSEICLSLSFSGDSEICLSLSFFERKKRCIPLLLVLTNNCSSTGGCLARNLPGIELASPVW